MYVLFYLLTQTLIDKYVIQFISLLCSGVPKEHAYMHN